LQAAAFFSLNSLLLLRRAAATCNGPSRFSDAAGSMRYENFCSAGKNLPKEKGKSQRQERKLQSMKNGDTRLPHLSFGKQARGREFQKHSSANTTGWIKLRLVIFFAMFVPLCGWPQDDDEYLPVNFLKDATLIQPQKKSPLQRIASESFLIAG